MLIDAHRWWVLCACLGLFALAGSAESAGSFEQRSITFYSDGVRLAGDIFVPATDSTRSPAVLLVHGWGGTKDHLNRAYASRFAQHGFLALTFDYRGWGASDGDIWRTSRDAEPTEVREVVNPLAQLVDIRNALAFLLGEPKVDSSRIAIWGTSLGGGLALQIAGEMPSIKVLVSQVGAVNSKANMVSPQLKRYVWEVQSTRVRDAAGEFPFPQTPGLRGKPDLFAFSRYDPFRWHEELQAATLIIDARDEELFDIAKNGKALYAKVNDRLAAKYVAVPTNHYGIYSGPGYEQALAETLQWLQQHLGPKISPN